MVQSLMTVHGDLDSPDGRRLRSMRFLLSLACSFDQSRCKIATFWIDQIDERGRYETLYTLMPDMDDKEPELVSHGPSVATIRQAVADTYTVDIETRRVTYVHELSKTRGEGVCVDRPPPMLVEAEPSRSP
jgi:hypothetical protein